MEVNSVSGAVGGSRTHGVSAVTDFLTTPYYYGRIAALLRCSLEHVFTISFNLGSWCMLSTHLQYYY